MQGFNEENANLFVILFIKGLLVRTNVRTYVRGGTQSVSVSSKILQIFEVVESTNSQYTNFAEKNCSILSKTFQRSS